MHPQRRRGGRAGPDSKGEQRKMRRTTVLAALAAMLITMLPAVALARGADEWSQYQKDAGHGGAIDIALPSSNKVMRRTAALNAVDGSQPVVAGDRAYFLAGTAGADGKVYCFDLRTGRQVWTRAVGVISGMESWSSPAIADGVVYTASGSMIHALNSSTGAVLWTKDLKTIKATADVVNSSPAIDGGKLVIGDFTNGCYYCLDLKQQGKHLWTFSLEANTMAIGTAAIDGGRVYVVQSAALGAPVFPNGKVWCVDESTGKAVTSWGTDGAFTTVNKIDVCCAPALYGDFIYFTDFIYANNLHFDAANPSSYLYCLNKHTGAEAWKVKTYGTEGAVSVSDGTIVVSGQQPAVWPDVGTNKTVAFNADTTLGQKPVRRWLRDGIGGPNMSVCIGKYGRIAVGNNATSGFPPVVSTDTYVLDIATGNTVWHSTEGGSSPVPTQYGLLSIADGRMVTFGSGGLPAGEFYFAEGTTREGYQEWICLVNPTARQQACRIEYMINGGGNREQDVVLAPNSRTTVDVNLFLGPGLDVSARVTGSGHFVAERSMYFAAGGLDGGEQVLGRAGTSTRFLFAEGTTRSGFQTWLALQNPGDAEANVLVTYVYADGTPPVPQNVVVPAKSRLTVDVNSGAGAEKDVSMAVNSTRRIVAERVMYFTCPTPILGSRPSGVHNCSGADEGATSWYFAEGTTRGNFQQWLCLMNPTGREAEVTVRYMKASGPAVDVRKTLEADSRTTIDVNAEVGPDQDVSVLVTSDEPIVAERPMYFQLQPGAGALWKGGHNSTGAVYSAYRWEFAEGCTREGFITYLCIANPGAAGQKVTIDYFVTGPDGRREKKSSELTVAANSRRTVVVNDEVGAGVDVSATLTCAAPIVVERPMYFSFDRYTDGGVSLGLPGAP